jgi:hypothetical protein
MQRWPRVTENEWCAVWKISGAHKSHEDDPESDGARALREQIEENRRQRDGQ